MRGPTSVSKKLFAIRLVLGGSDAVRARHTWPTVLAGSPIQCASLPAPYNGARRLFLQVPVRIFLGAGEVLNQQRSGVQKQNQQVDLLIMETCFLVHWRQAAESAGDRQLHRLISETQKFQSFASLPLSHHFSILNARSVFQRLGAPRRSSSKYALPEWRF